MPGPGCAGRGRPERGYPLCAQSADDGVEAEAELSRLLPDEAEAAAALQLVNQLLVCEDSMLTANLLS